MKIILASVLLLAGLIANAEDKSSGCGLGWQVASHNSLISSYTRAITNASTSSTFGMTSGTSGCDKHSIVDANKEDVHYAEANFHSLMVEMAQGQGEYVHGLAVVMGCSDNQVGQFEQMSQKNYQQLFPSQGTNPWRLIDGVKSNMRKEGVCNNNTI